MMQRVIATIFLGFHFMKTVVERTFRIHRRGLAEFRKEYHV